MAQSTDDENVAPAPLPTNDQPNDNDVPVPPSIDIASKKKKKIKSHLDDAPLTEQKESVSHNERASSVTRSQLELYEQKMADPPSPWKKETAPFKKMDYVTVDIGPCVQISRNEFIAVPTFVGVHNGSNGIYKYNTDTKEWQLVLLYPQNMYDIEFHTICYDKIHHILYIASTLTGIIQCNLQTKKIEIMGDQQRTYEVYGKGSGARIMCIEGELNFFFGKDNSRHVRWDEYTKIYEVVRDFKEFTNGLLAFGLVYNDRKKQLLLMGGFRGTGLGRSDEIWGFNMNPKRGMIGWEKLEITMPDKMQSFACVITSDCKNVLIFGGSDSNGLSQKILILNLETMKWRESKVPLPYQGVKVQQVLLMRSEQEALLVNGFLRETVDEMEMNGVWALDLNGVIFDFYVNEEVHVVIGGMAHYKIPLVEILNA